MKKKTLTVALAIALATSVTTSSCIGSFALTNKLLAWNESVSNKFVNEIVFLAFCIVPVYEVSALADLVVLNTIEFWSGSSPVASNSKIVDGQDGKYMVSNDSNGYTIKNLTDGTVTRLNFRAEDKSWTVVNPAGKEICILSYVDDTHVRVPLCNGKEQIVELTHDGLYAYQSSVLGNGVVAAL